MKRVGQYVSYDNFKDFLEYWSELPEQKNSGKLPDIADVKFSTVSTLAQINGKYTTVLDIDFPDGAKQPTFNFSPELIESFDYEKGYKIIFDESDNSILAFEFYEKSDDGEILNILIGPDISKTFFAYYGSSNNSRNK